MTADAGHMVEDVRGSRMSDIVMIAVILVADCANEIIRSAERLIPRRAQHRIVTFTPILIRHS